MGLLIALGLRRPNPWERRTLLDWILFSPLQYLASIFYPILLALRGHPFHPPRNKKPIKVVCISDTHDNTFPVPRGDLLIHAGDMSSIGTAEAIQKQVDWLASQPHEHKIVVCGNHDNWFDPEARKDEDSLPGARRVHLRGLILLQRQSTTLGFFGGKRVLNIYGAADVPALSNDRSEHAFQYPHYDPPWDGIIPRSTDILVTHTPPSCHMDLGLGCPALLDEVWRVKPRLHVFGHVHWGRGRESAYFDRCQAAYESLMSRPGHGLIWDCVPNFGWIDAIKMLFHGAQSILFKWLMQGPGGGEGCLMVNAAMMIGSTGKMRKQPEIVYI